MCYFFLCVLIPDVYGPSLINVTCGLPQSAPLHTCGRDYYLLLIDDATRYVTLKFLKDKSDAAYEIQSYMSHLQIRGHVTYVIKIDCGTEFLNQPMKTWCDE